MRAAYLSAPINALLDGLYEGTATVADILREGDLGLGTFEDLDGEMVVLDGRAWQVDNHGQAREVDGTARTPFACVAPFHADTIDQVPTGTGIEDAVTGLIPSPNMLYAIRIQGVFEGLRVRSVPRQEAYTPLVEVAKQQATFDFPEAEGTLCGFWTPAFLHSVAVPGCHLHFLDAARERGGHLLSGRIRVASIALMHLPRLNMALPMTLDFLTADLGRDSQAELGVIEKEG
ncbi:alpha-acetolactate decarboxylase [Pseudoroseomonas deserti]|uniref:Alpha-acetolactate decarboxylase n=1 Tax=Teichococcus deserti TaxID=1817963 RepID=A0A1V2H3Q8_9PROT|nr:acetolactate decarboxylase [Pseudoroseomonas deserti]ONG54986.1 alpha-acetolactate decarboxylase [Pseudoroseomonas deserti]